MVVARPEPIDLPPGPRRDLRDLLRRLAHDRKLGNASVARSTGRSRSYLTEIFQGRKSPAPETAVAMAASMGRPRTN